MKSKKEMLDKANSQPWWENNTLILEALLDIRNVMIDISLLLESQHKNPKRRQKIL